MTIRSIGKNWQFLPAISETSAVLEADIACHPLVARVLAQRGVTDAHAARAFLNPAYYKPAPPESLPDMARAVNLLGQYITAAQRILIWGDFDVDGQTATALLVEGLRQLNTDVVYHIPHRLRESHGIQVSQLEALIQQTKPALLLTCDTGISAHEAIEHANERGLSVIVTDHHDLPPTLPPASALINPKRLPTEHPLRSLPGVGVAYKLIQALYAHLGREPAETEVFLDLVALGIVADVAEQTHDTRYLLQLGLERLRHTQRPGIKALIEVAGLSPDALSEETIGFQLGPRLNAAGRLGDAAQAVDLLLTTDPVQARVIAANLDGLNKKRQIIQRQMLAAAQEVIARQPDLLSFTALVLYHEGWHPGLLGIVAGQLAERYGRPCVLLTEAEEEAAARGSARSVPGYDIGQAIAAQAELLHTHGGHPGAAGLSLPIDNIPAFRRRLSRTLQAQERATAEPALEINAQITLSEVTPNLVDALMQLAPFGAGNPPVVLAATDVTIESSRLLGREKRHRQIVVSDSSGVNRTALWWNGAEHALPSGQFDLAFTPGWNTYRGQRELSLTVAAIRLPSPAPDTAPRASQEIEIIDWRGDASVSDPVAAFHRLEPVGHVWVEGPQKEEITGSTRYQITPTSALLIFTAPPNSAVLREAIEAAAPDRIYLAGVNPPGQQTTPLLRYLLGLCKYTINHRDGIADLEKMAAAAAQTVETTYWGIRVLAAQHIITLTETDDTLLVAAPTHAGSLPASEDTAPLEEAASTFRALLAETAAYRRFFSHAPMEALLA